MRKIYSFMVAAVALFSAASCNKEFTNEQDNLPVGEVVTFEASVDGADTKAVLDGKVSNWEKDDKITIHNGTKGYEFTTQDAGTTATFTYVGNDFSDGKFMAVYPAGVCTSADVDAKTVNAYIPTYQQAQIGTYHHDAALAIAYTDDNTLAFKNATTLLKFIVNADNVTHVVFHGNNNEAITGNAQVILGDRKVSSVQCLDTKFDWGTQKGTWVECYAWHNENDKYFKKGETYYIAVAPATFEKGVTAKIKIDDGEEIIVNKTDSKVTSSANTILNIGTLGGILYMKLQNVWVNNDERYAAYFYNANGNKWVDMTDLNKDNIYEVEIPDGYKSGDNVIFARMNGAATENKWENKWNQTADLTIPKGEANLYTVKSWDGSNNNNWSKKF